jgi:hypothetical protein
MMTNTGCMFFGCRGFVRACWSGRSGLRQIRRIGSSVGSHRAQGPQARFPMVIRAAAGMAERSLREGGVLPEGKRPDGAGVGFRIAA